MDHTKHKPLRQGQAAEQAAHNYLRNKGLQLVARNYHCRRGEIDLIMTHRDTLVFIEVRYRRRHCFGSGMESVGHTKQSRIIHCAMHFLQRHSALAERPARFDVVAITQGRSGDEITWIQDAFQT